MEDSPSDVDSLLSVETSLSQDTRISEGTPLIPNDEPKADYGDGDVNNTTADFTDLDIEYYELDKPWPATFERSISLLAGPIMDTTFIEQVTKSPKITPNLSARRKNANYQTPEAQGRLIGSKQHQFKQEINKVQSLDFNRLDPSRRSMDAKIYRQKLLAEAARKKNQKLDGKPDVETGVGAGKDKLTKKKPAVDAHGMSSSDKATVPQCIFNMANVLMGVGMLGLPYILKSAGWIGGLFVTTTFSFAAWRTSILLGRELNGDPRPCHLFAEDPTLVRLGKPLTSFPAIAMEAFGPIGNVILSFILYFELFSCLSIFLVTLGDHMHSLFPLISVGRHITHFAFLLVVPIALLRTPRLLSYLSAVGTFATACVVLSVLGYALYCGDISEEVAVTEKVAIDRTHIYWRTNGLPIAFGLIAYTFSGHAIIPSIYSTMKEPQKYEPMIAYSFIAVVSCCFIVALSGYYMFGSLVEDQITLSLEDYAGSDNKIMMSVTWLMILTAFSKFTLTAFPLALGMEEIVAPCIPSDDVMEWVSSLIKLLIIISSSCVAIYCPSFSFLCSLVGLICTMVVSVIFPAAAHLKLFNAHLPLWEKVVDWLFVILGTIMTVVGTIQAIETRQ